MEIFTGHFRYPSLISGNYKDMFGAETGNLQLYNKGIGE